MKNFKLKDFTRGWVVGNFFPSIYKKDYEIGIKYYSSGEYEDSHCHKLSDEVTIIVLGAVKINGITYSGGDVVIQEKGEFADFLCISDLAITCVYRPDGSFTSDKYFKKYVENNNKP